MMRPRVLEQSCASDDFCPASDRIRRTRFAKGASAMGGRPGTDRPGHGALSGRRFGAAVPRVPDHLAAGRLDWFRNGSIDAVLAFRPEADPHDTSHGGVAVRGIGSTAGVARLEDGIPPS